MMWSMTGDKGCGYFNDLSTGSPQIPQVFLVLIIIFLFFQRRLGEDHSDLVYLGGYSFREGPFFLVGTGVEFYDVGVGVFLI